MRDQHPEARVERQRLFHVAQGLRFAPAAVPVPLVADRLVEDFIAGVDRPAEPSRGKRGHGAGERRFDRIQDWIGYSLERRAARDRASDLGVVKA